jgi:hypothetical protein
VIEEEATFLLGMSRDASIGAFLGFGTSTFLFIGIFVIDSIARHVRRIWKG